MDTEPNEWLYQARRALTTLFSGKQSLQQTSIGFRRMLTLFLEQLHLLAQARITTFSPQACDTNKDGHGKYRYDSEVYPVGCDSSTNQVS